ncbi:hypothetical protein Pla8534_13450 [Lignipirellula cremea]|uniref:DUF1598 domain-containing protein n=2 Tax=Lignipirellula cremea TaxID=2528010 RepID=A0A518DP06_9BACT|nr:hypothetical protein Pla8534_13450 [Lignipirellula cremea]
MLRYWLALGAILLGMTGGGLLLAADPLPGDMLGEHLAAGEFGPALALVNALPDPAARNAGLARVAAAQAAGGARSASLLTGARISDGSLRSLALNLTAASPLRSGRGGGAVADFDPLMELITSTISPDSWDEVGGPGSLDGFAGGVYADPAGVMRRLVTTDGGRSLLEVHREVAASLRGSPVVHETELRKISLPRLERELQLAEAAGREPSEEMQALAGIYKIQYVLVYPETGDLVIAGPAGPWMNDAEGRRVNIATGRPVLNLDDLVLTLRNAYKEDSAFGCSINPRRANLVAAQNYLAESAKTPLKPTDASREKWLKGLRDALELQDIVVYGIPAETRAARVIVEADYHMKLIGMGLQEGTPGVPSFLSMVTLGPDGNPPAMNVLRWWFTMNYDAVSATESRDGFEIFGQGVKCQSENEALTEAGERVHTGKADAPNAEFARNFTKHYPDLAVRYPIYAELQNIFDLALVAALIKGEDLAGRVHWEMAWLAPREETSNQFQLTLGRAVKEVETVANYRVIDRKHITAGASGGVTVRARGVFKQGFVKRDDSQNVIARRSESAPKSLTARAWWWD